MPARCLSTLHTITDDFVGSRGPGRHSARVSAHNDVSLGVHRYRQPKPNARTFFGINKLAPGFCRFGGRRAGLWLEIEVWGRVG